MKVAVLADVHANDLALKAVLKDARKRDVDAIWYLGDFLGYNPFPNKVVERLRKSKAVCIVGNYDLKVLNFSKKD